MITVIRSKYDVQDISLQSNSVASTQTSSSFKIGNVRDVEYQNTLLTSYIDSKFPQVTAEETDAIRYINRTINSKLPAVESVRHMTWHPVRFEFDNMFSYGEGNVVDFTNLQDVCGLFAANTSGKSSLLDAITYTIFDKCSKTGKAHEVLNNKKSSFVGKFTFELNNTTYTIVREGIKNKNGHVKVNVNFFTDTQDLNGEERSDTNKSIRQYLGTYDDFILTAFSLQADNNNFIEKSQRERKDLLSQFLDITVFEQLYKLAADEIKETAGKLKEYKKTDFADIILTADSTINTNQADVVTLEQDEHELHEQRNQKQESILALIESKLPTTYNGPGLEDLQSQETELLANIESIHSDIENYEMDLTTLNNSINSNKQLLNTYDVDSLNANIETITELQQTLQNTQKLLQKQQEVVNAKEQKIEHLSTHQYDPNCKYCTSNVFVQNAIEAQNTIDQDRTILNDIKNKVTELTDKITELTPAIATLTEYKALKQNIATEKIKFEKLELQLQILENELQTREAELENTVERQESFKQNETAIKHNKIIDDKIIDCKSEIDTITTTLKEIQGSIKSKHGLIEVAKTKKSAAIKNLEQYQKLETEYKAYEYYLSAVNRDGVPYELVSKALPSIETEINNVLNQVVNFNMVLNTDGKNINGYIIYDEDNFWPLELTSGMERFISSLAIRIALINVSALPRPNFIAIDEGWGSLDAEHISAVVNLFEYFRTKFDFSIIISHVDTMRDMVDNLIEVNKINGFSQILHN
jgi:DNA repair exonuclease SbcCD ATPase subunit